MKPMHMAYLILIVWLAAGIYSLHTVDPVLAFISGTFAGPSFALAAKSDLQDTD